MQTSWNLKNGVPLALTLAADARLGATDYTDDHIWRFHSAGGEPQALALQTTFGLRARSFRIFPRFQEGERDLIDPSDFFAAPELRAYYPNYLWLSCEPFQEIDVQIEYWVPQSQAISGRVRFHNRGAKPRQLRFYWIAQLFPNEGQRMAPVEMNAVQTLVGQTEDLHPLLFMTGGPQAVSSPFPALIQDVSLEPGQLQTIIWVESARGSPQESFELARELATRPWEAEIARLEMLNAGMVVVQTGNPDWDAALALSQNLASSLLVGPTTQLPDISFVQTRLPDFGYSRRGNGSDYSHLWSGQSVLETVYLSSFLLPGYANVVQGLIQNYLVTQAEDGSLDWKPGLAGQRATLMATPLLADLAWRAYQCSQDKNFLHSVFPKLLTFIQAWFSEQHDRDGDGVPEWDHVLQVGIENHPLFSRGYGNAVGVDIATSESPALCVFLYRECRALIEMAGELDRPDAIPALNSFADHLSAALESMWDEATDSFHYTDRDTHQTTSGASLASGQGSGEIQLDVHFDQPVRLLVKVSVGKGTTPRPRLIIHGAGKSGQHRIEHVSEDRFKWFLRRGVLTGERVYSYVERIEIQGLQPDDLVEISSVDYRLHDISLLLPLWTGIPQASRAEAILHKSVMDPDRYWQPYGLPYCDLTNNKEFAGTAAQPLEREDEQDLGEIQTDSSADTTIDMPWNYLVGLGLLKYGFRSQTAELVRRLMKAIVENLRQHGAFFNKYDAKNGAGIGERNTLAGLAPLHLFLETIGVHIFSPFKVLIVGTNPFPRSVTVKYRGMGIIRRRNSAVIRFSDGQIVTVKGPSAQLVALQTQTHIPASRQPRSHPDA